MWPFTSRRIFGSRWWALAFVAFVCWQAAQLVGTAKPGEGVALEGSVLSETSDNSDAPPPEGSVASMFETKPAE